MNTRGNYERSWLQQVKAKAKELYTEIMERDLYGCSDSAALHALTDKAELAAEMKFNRLTLQYARGEKEPELKHLCNWLKQRRPHYEQVFLASHPTAAFTEALNRHLNAGPTGPKTMDVDAAPARADNSKMSPGKHRGRPPSVILIKGHLVRGARDKKSQRRFVQDCDGMSRETLQTAEKKNLATDETIGKLLVGIRKNGVRMTCEDLIDK